MAKAQENRDKGTKGESFSLCPSAPLPLCPCPITSDSISLVAVGDICLGLGVRDSIQRFGPDFPFAHCRSILQSADLAFGNLEVVLYAGKTPLKGMHIPKGMPREHHPDFKVPLHYGEGLSRAGFHVLSAANNHIMDFGAPACRDTLNYLKSQGISPVGCGGNLSEARRPVVLSVRETRIGFLAYADDVGQAAGPNRPGVAPLRKKYILEDIRAIRPLVDLIVISLHADLEFVAYPAPSRVRLCRRLIDAGADLILQHHPHVPQGVERYRQGLIVYSLGSFVFPIQGNSYADRPHTDRSFILKVWMRRRKIMGAEFVPVGINRCHQPVPLAGEERRAFLRYLHTISIPLHRLDLLDRFWAQTCRHYFKINWSWLKEIYWDQGCSGVLRRLIFLARTSENQRWLSGLLPGLLRFERPRCCSPFTSGP